MGTVKQLKRPNMSIIMQGKQNRLGKKMSEEQKAARKEKMGSKLVSPRRIAIVDLDTGLSYPSISHAALALGIHISSITRALKLGLSLRSGKRFAKLDEPVAVGF